MYCLNFVYLCVLDIVKKNFVCFACCASHRGADNGYGIKQRGTGGWAVAVLRYYYLVLWQVKKHDERWMNIVCNVYFYVWFYLYLVYLIWLK